MSTADPIPLDALSDENRAILSLLLIQRRGYHEIAELLQLDPVRVRERAHAAIETLAPTQLPRPEPAVRARIADYLVGEQSVSERTLTRARLARSEPERAWAAAIALALMPLANDALPAIPDSDPTPPAEPDPTASGPDPPFHATRRSSRALIACLGLLAVGAIAVILIVGLSGGGKGHRAPVPATNPGRTIERLPLSPVGTDRTAGGTATIVRPAHGGLLLLVQGRGLPANQNDSYAVWLINRPGDSRLLGFISPNVGAGGTFSSGTPLPSDAARFRELIVTLETTSRPVAPGQAVLRSRLRLAVGSGQG